MSSDNNECVSSKQFYFKFIGDKTDISNEKMFGNFDTNYLNLNNLPVNYYPLYKPDLSTITLES
jgi:hypothetical protein